MMKIGFAHTLVATLSLVCLSLAAAQTQVEIEEEGRIIRIGPDGEAGRSIQPIPVLPPGGRVPPTFTFPGGANLNWNAAVSKFAIGVSTTSIDDQLRAHVDLPADAGLMAQSVVEDSPAAKAGLQQYDILLKVDGKPITEMQQLVEAVDAAGEKEESLKLEVIRKGESLSVEVKPTKRENMAATLAVPLTIPRGNDAVPGDAPTFQWRGLGPAVRLDGQLLPPANVPDGVSISISKQNDEPTRITIKRDGETYEVVGDDKEALKKLPEDLRPIAERMLNGNAVFQGFPGGSNTFEPISGPLPDAFRLRVEQNRARAEAAADEARTRMEERMAEMEARIQELHEQMSRRLEEREGATKATND